MIGEGNHIGCRETSDMIVGTFFISANARDYTLRSDDINTFFISANARDYTLRAEWSPHGDLRISNHPLKKKNHIGYQKAPDMIAGTFFITAHACDYTLRIECIRKPHGR